MILNRAKAPFFSRGTIFCYKVKAISNELDASQLITPSDFFVL